MPPKPKKASAKKSNATGAAGANANWESGLITAPFEEVCGLTEVVLWFNSAPYLSVVFYCTTKQGVDLL